MIKKDSDQKPTEYPLRLPVFQVDTNASSFLAALVVIYHPVPAKFEQQSICSFQSRKVGPHFV